MANEQLFDMARDAIQELHDDRSVTKEEAIINLEALRDEIDMLIEGLKY